jgi:predicted metalloprotease with PDZ domain
LIEAFAQRSADLRDRLPQWLQSVDDPDLDGYLNTVGLSLEPVAASSAWIGLTAAVEAGQLLARRVQRASPAQQAGVMVGDELVGLDGQRLRDPAQLAAALRAGDLQELLISRRSQLRSLSIWSQAARPESFRLVADPSATAQQKALQERWLALLPGVTP